MKHKVLSDPVHGFIHIPSGLPHELVEHPFFQRLRRIKQLGMTSLVFPGAIHTRFQHVLGATYLTQMAIESLQSKGADISSEEAEAVTTAILLHDIGHGPFSHALEYSIVDGIKHERLSELFMDRLNTEFDGRLDLAIQIFKNEYHKPFLHQLVSSQLDMDRLDYLRRDSFFTGVSEGAIGSARIIKMLNVVDGNLAVEAKGIYSIENFLIARRLMYWQVYLHKTSLAAEEMLVRILKRAKYLADKGENLFGTPALCYFLNNKVGIRQFKSREKVVGNKDALEVFADLDDNDIMVSIKVWSEHADKVLSYLCKAMKDRHLFKIEISKKPFPKEYVASIRKNVKNKLECSNHALNYLVVRGSITNNAYSRADDRINILFKDGSQQDIGKASDMLNISVLSKTVKKYYICYPKFKASL